MKYSKLSKKDKQALDNAFALLLDIQDAMGNVIAATQTDESCVADQEMYDKSTHFIEWYKTIAVK